MILTCPECGTQYVVKDAAIPPGGRQVRCASCKHSWHQDPEDGATPAEVPEVPAPAPEIGESEAAPTNYDQVPSDAMPWKAGECSRNLAGSCGFGDGALYACHSAR